MQQVYETYGIGPFEQTGDDAWPSCFAVTDLATLSMGCVGAALAEFVAAAGGESKPAVRIDRRLASLWFRWSIHPQGWETPPSWDAIAGDYRSGDGWIKIHTNAPHHRAAVLSVLDCAPDRESVANKIRAWNADDLENAVVAAGGAAAVLRSRSGWRAHPQGKSVAGEPLVHWMYRSGGVKLKRFDPERPLAGVRVLDLTRVLAGPVATRTLAGFGAEVLRIDPPHWDEPGVVPDVTLGKRCAHLDLKRAEHLEQFKGLLRGADILVHGYRPGALDALVAPEMRAELAPKLIEICLDAYGWTGPWAGRRGFDSLVQMSCGIAEAGMRWQKADKPFPLPVQALDHATGYFMAAAAIASMTRALKGEGLATTRLSLARTAELLAEMSGDRTGGLKGSTADDLDTWIENTPWGPAKRLKPAIQVAGSPMRWDRTATALGSAPARWG